MDYGTPTPSSTPPLGGDRSDWNKPLPELIPPPTYAPAFMAAGIVFLLWGPLTHWLVSATGLGFMITSITIWMRAIRKDWKISK